MEHTHMHDSPYTQSLIHIWLLFLLVVASYYDEFNIYKSYGFFSIKNNK